MRILVFMSDNRKLFPTLAGADYNSLAAVINKEYCKRHGYDFIYYRPHLPENTHSLFNCKEPVTGDLRHASWSKLLSTSRALQEPYEYVVYIDSDCIFKDFDHKIENFLTEADILIASDFPYRKTFPCAGMYICKVNDRVREFIAEWYSVSIPSKNIEHPWEQKALDTIFKRPGISMFNTGNFFNEVEGQPLRHVTGHTKLLKAQRIPYFLAFLDQHEIPFDISDIRCIEYST
jgi:hypothetical protein